MVLLYPHPTFSFKKQLLQAANTDLYNPLVSKGHNSVSVQIYYFLYE